MSDGARIAEFWRLFSAGPGRWPIPGEDFDLMRIEPVLALAQETFPELLVAARWKPSSTA